MQNRFERKGKAMKSGKKRSVRKMALVLLMPWMILCIPIATAQAASVAAEESVQERIVMSESLGEGLSSPEESNSGNSEDADDEADPGQNRSAGLYLEIISIGFSALAIIWAIAAMVSASRKKSIISKNEFEEKWAELSGAMSKVEDQMKKIYDAQQEQEMSLRGLSMEKTEAVQQKKAAAAPNKAMSMREEDAAKKHMTAPVKQEIKEEKAIRSENSGAEPTMIAKCTGRYVTIEKGILAEQIIRVVDAPGRFPMALYDNDTVKVDESRYAGNQAGGDFLIGQGVPLLFEVVVDGRVMSESDLHQEAGFFEFKRVTIPAKVKLDKINSRVTHVQKGRAEFEKCIIED